MCVKAVDTYPSWYKTQEMCDKVVSADLFMIKNCLGKYKTQEMCD